MRRADVISVARPSAAPAPAQPVPTPEAGEEVKREDGVEPVSRVVPFRRTCLIRIRVAMEAFQSHKALCKVLSGDEGWYLYEGWLLIAASQCVDGDQVSRHRVCMH